MRRWQVFSGFAALSGALLLFLGFDSGYPMAQHCFSAPSDDLLLKGIGLEQSNCFSADPIGSFNWKLWILVEAGVAILLAIGSFIVSGGLFRATSWSRGAWLGVVVLAVLYFGVFWIAPGGKRAIAGFVLSGLYACTFIASLRLLPRGQSVETAP